MSAHAESSTPRIDADASWSSQYARRRAVSQRFGDIFQVPLAKRPYNVLLGCLSNDVDVLEVGAGDRRMKERLQSRFPGLRYESMDVDACGEHDYTSLESIDKRFNVVFAFEVAEHIDRRALAPWIASLADLLKPGGWLVLSTPNTYYPPAYLRDITHLTPLCYDEFGAVLESCGLRVERIYRVYNDPLHRMILRRFVFGWLFRLLGLDYARQIVVAGRRPVAIAQL